jgi:hypothetical protein
VTFLHIQMHRARHQDGNDVDLVWNGAHLNSKRRAIQLLLHGDRGFLSFYNVGGAPGA